MADIEFDLNDGLCVDGVENKHVVMRGLTATLAPMPAALPRPALTPYILTMLSFSAATPTPVVPSSAGLLP